MSTRLLDRILDRPSSLFFASLLAISTAFPAHSHAQEGVPITTCPELRDGCQESDVEFHYREGFFDSFSYDTGWIPSGSPLQVRFAIAGGGETEIDLAGRSIVWWPAPLSIAVPGTPGTGRLSIDYGLEIVAKVRFDVTVAGTRYTWEGDIPLPGNIPRDLRLAAMVGFDSMLLPPQLPRPIAITDMTSPFRYEVDITDSIIPLPGIGGGLVVDFQPRMSAAYQTTRIEIGDAALPIVTEGGSTVATADEGETGFGAAKDVVITPVGDLDYDGVVAVAPALFVEIAGRRFDLPITTLDVPLLDLDREIRFPSATVHVPLPDLRLEPRHVDFGEVELGLSATQLLEIRNEGEAELRVTPRAAPEPFALDTAAVVVPPHSSRSVEVAFAPVEIGEAAAMLFVDSDDPDESTVIVRLEGIGIAGADGGYAGDAGRRGGPDTAGGCACRSAGTAGGSPTGALGIAALAMILVITRRRR
ncbi:Hypothetical protein I5071_79850 [Sandaracinus amylolyticus]|nr:Hypothetical protein I5071_79850 [Sandaracinus amylolyticus]